MAYNVTGTAGNDTLVQISDAGPGTISGLAGNDSIRSGTGIVSISGDWATTRSAFRPATSVR